MQTPINKWRTEDNKWDLRQIWFLHKCRKLNYWKNQTLCKCLFFLSPPFLPLFFLSIILTRTMPLTSSRSSFCWLKRLAIEIMNPLSILTFMACTKALAYLSIQIKIAIIQVDPTLELVGWTPAREVWVRLRKTLRFHRASFRQRVKNRF